MAEQMGAQTIKDLVVGANTHLSWENLQVDDELDLRGLEIDVPLSFRGCSFSKSIRLDQAILRSLDLTDSTIAGLSAPGATIRGDFVARNVTSSATLKLALARIEGALDLRKATLNPDEGLAVDADGLVTHRFIGDGIVASGTIRLSHGRIATDLDLTGASLQPRSGRAVAASAISIGGTVKLRSSDQAAFVALGGLDFSAATVGRALDATGAQVTAAGVSAFDGRGMTCPEVSLCWGCTVDGAVRLDRAKILGTLLLDGATLRNSSGRTLQLDGASLGRLSMCARTNEQDQPTQFFKSVGEIRMRRARVEGDADLRGAKLESPNVCLDAGGASIAGSLLAQSYAGPGPEGIFEARGTIRLNEAVVGAFITFEGATLAPPTGDAIYAENVTVKGGLFLRARPQKDGPGGQPFISKGPINLYFAKIGANLVCNGAQLGSPTDLVLNGTRCEVGGSVLMGTWKKDGSVPISFVADGRLSFFGARIGDALSIQGRVSARENGVAIEASEVTAKVIDLAGVTARGAIKVAGTTVAGNLNCRGTTVTTAQGWALDAERAKIGGTVYLTTKNQTAFQAIGGIRFQNANIGCNLEADGAQLTAGRELDDKGEYKSLPAAHLETVTIGASLLLRRGCRALGTVRLFRAKIGGQLECQGGQFSLIDGDALSAYGVTINGDCSLTDGFELRGRANFKAAKIGGALRLRGGKYDAQSSLDLEEAKAGQIEDGATTWPAKGKLSLVGFTYDSIAAGSSTSAEQRIEWIERQSQPYLSHPQPYECLARVLRQMGHDRDARRVAIRKHIAARSGQGVSPAARARSRFLNATIGYGYQPWKAVAWLAALWLIGAFAVWCADTHNLMTFVSSESCQAVHGVEPAVPKATVAGGGVNASASPSGKHPAPLVFSLDGLIPTLHLQQQSCWQPSQKRFAGQLFGVFFAFQSFAGALLAGLAVAAVTGLLKKD